MTRDVALVDELRRLESECGWVEFKHNNIAPELIGKLCSALANGARYENENEEIAYLLWGNHI